MMYSYSIIKAGSGWLGLHACPHEYKQERRVLIQNTDAICLFCEKLRVRSLHRTKDLVPVRDGGSHFYGRRARPPNNRYHDLICIFVLPNSRAVVGVALVRPIVWQCRI